MVLIYSLNELHEAECFLEGYSRSADQEIPRLLWNSKYHKILPLVPILSVFIPPVLHLGVFVTVHVKSDTRITSYHKHIKEFRSVMSLLSIHFKNLHGFQESVCRQHV